MSRSSRRYATEPCGEKSNEIKAMHLLMGKLDIAGHVVTMDAMAMQKDIVDTICNKDVDSLIELKTNQKSLMYGVEDRLGSSFPLQTFTDQDLTTDTSRPGPIRSMTVWILWTTDRNGEKD